MRVARQWHCVRKAWQFIQTQRSTAALRLVPMRLMPRAMSIILTGVSLATVCAASVGAYVGDIWGWRTAFMIATVVAALALLVQLATIPKLPPVGVASFRTLLDVLKRPSIRVALLVAS